MIRLGAAGSLLRRTARQLPPASTRLSRFSSAAQRLRRACTSRIGVHRKVRVIWPGTSVQAAMSSQQARTRALRAAQSI